MASRECEKLKGEVRVRNARAAIGILTLPVGGPEALQKPPQTRTVESGRRRPELGLRCRCSSVLGAAQCFHSASPVPPMNPNKRPAPHRKLPALESASCTSVAARKLRSIHQWAVLRTHNNWAAEGCRVIPGTAPAPQY